MKPYHAIIHPTERVCVVRHMDEGISDAEWASGCRVLLSNAVSRSLLEQDAWTKGYKVINKDDWRELFHKELQEFYRSTMIPWDKWDKKQEIY